MPSIEQHGGASVADKRIDFAYDAASRWGAITRYADLAGTDLVATSTYTFDDASRLIALTHAQDTTILADYDWVYDIANRITQFDSATDGVVDYTYDDTNQLTAADFDYQTDESYTYDANGNRTNTGYSTGDNNRLTSDGTYNYEYDDEGNRTKKTEISSGDYVVYEWDHRNRLTAVRFKDSSHDLTKQVEYDYDAFNRRTVKRLDANGDNTFESAWRFVYDDSNIVLVFDESEDLANRYLHGPAVDQILASEDGAGDVLWPLADNQGTIRDVASYDAIMEETDIVKHLTYGAFGQLLTDSAPGIDFLYAYIGREWDPHAELFYYRARWYDPLVGRFISEDPIGFDGDQSNIYRYAKNSPTLLVDPSGLDPSAYIGCEVSSPYYAAMSGNNPVPPSIPPAPDVAPGPEWWWEDGVWKHPNGEWLHPDLNHKPPKKPHWEWKDKWGNKWEYYPDTGKWIPKKVNPNKPQPIFPPGTFDAATKIVIVACGGYILNRIAPFISGCAKPALGRCFAMPIMLDYYPKPDPTTGEYPVY